MYTHKLMLSIIIDGLHEMLLLLCWCCLLQWVETVLILILPW